VVSKQRTLGKDGMVRVTLFSRPPGVYFDAYLPVTCRNSVSF
jgi:hypothetical protein